MSFLKVKPWSSLVEGDEQLDRPNSQTCMEWYSVCIAYFFWICHNTTTYHLGQYSLHLLLLKSSMTYLCGNIKLNMLCCPCSSLYSILSQQDLIKIIFFKRAIPGLFFVYFRLFNFFNKCQFSILCWDSNPQPSKHESPPITNRPGLLHLIKVFNLW